MSIKKLTLPKETLRVLHSQETSHVQAGNETDPCTTSYNATWCRPTNGCTQGPCGVTKPSVVQML